MPSEFSGVRKFLFTDVSFVGALKVVQNRLFWFTSHICLQCNKITRRSGICPAGAAGTGGAEEVVRICNGWSQLVRRDEEEEEEVFMSDAILFVAFYWLSTFQLIDTNNYYGDAEHNNVWGFTALTRYLLYTLSIVTGLGGRSWLICRREIK